MEFIGVKPAPIKYFWCKELDFNTIDGRVSRISTGYQEAAQHVTSDADKYAEKFHEHKT